MRGILTADRPVLEVLAQRLLVKEVVDEGELREIMGLPQRTRDPLPERVVETPPPKGGMVDDTRVLPAPAGEMGPEA